MQRWSTYVAFEGESHRREMAWNGERPWACMLWWSPQWQGRCSAYVPSTAHAHNDAMWHHDIMVGEIPVPKYAREKVKFSPASFWCGKQFSFEKWRAIQNCCSGPISLIWDAWICANKIASTDPSSPIRAQYCVRRKISQYSEMTTSWHLSCIEYSTGHSAWLIQNKKGLSSQSYNITPSKVSCRPAQTYNLSEN